MTTSCQPRKPQPQASGMAAIRASRGTTTKTPTSVRWATVAGCSSRSGRAVGRVGAGSGGIEGSAGPVGPGPGAFARVVEVVIVLLAGQGPEAWGSDTACLTLT